MREWFVSSHHLKGLEKRRYDEQLHIREVSPDQDAKIAAAAEKLREVSMAFQENWAIDWGECLDIANQLENLIAHEAEDRKEGGFSGQDDGLE